MKNTLKPLLAIIGLVLLGFLVWHFLIRGGTEGQIERIAGNGTPVGGITSAQTAVIQADVERFRKLLNELEQVKLSQSVFTQPQYGEKLNYTEEARQRLDELKEGSDILGRDNPFSVPNFFPGLTTQTGTAVSNQSRTAPRR